MAKSPARSRHDAVLIRVSTQGQDEKPQIANVQNILRQRGVEVPRQHWHEFKVSRRRVLTGPGFDHVMDMVKAGRIRDIYVESQDRFGGKSNKELFSVLKVLQDNNVRLFDLTNNRELTSDEFIDEIQTLFEGMKSVKELKDTSRRSLRSRVNNFVTSGSWPTGAAPFGFGKQVIKANGDVRFEWYGTKSRAIGELWFVDSDGTLTLSDTEARMPRKEATDSIFLTPHHDKKIIKAIRTLFDLFANHGLSYRQTAIRLNELGFSVYGRPFEFNIVREISRNPAYVGDTAFGRRQSGEYHSFDAEANIIALDKKTSEADLEASKQFITKQDTHEGIIDRKLWQLAQTKIANDSTDRENQRSQYSPRLSQYYLKNLLVCGHCGKGMTGRNDNVPKYVCGSYNTAKGRAAHCECGYHTITHAQAEQLIFAELKKIGEKKSEVTGKAHRKLVAKRLLERQQEMEDNEANRVKIIDEGLTALIKYLEATYDLTKAQIGEFKKSLRRAYRYGFRKGTVSDKVPLSLTELKKAVKAAEAQAVESAIEKLATYRSRMAILAEAHAFAVAEEKATLRVAIDRLEVQIADLKEKSKTVSERLKDYWDQQEDFAAEHEELYREYQNMDGRMKGERLKRIFESITLFWNKEWHEPEANPGRERKTERNGRWKYTLDTSKILWKYRVRDMIDTW